MNTSLDALDPRFKPLAMALLARLAEAHVLVLISNTRRTAAEQVAEIAAGNSWVKHSMHEDGLAIDVAPYAQFQLHGANKALWDTNDPVWLEIGKVGEALGLRWGGRFHPINALGVGKDPGHFEYALPPLTGVAA